MFSGCGFDGVLQLQGGVPISLKDVINYFKPLNAMPGSMMCIFFIDTYHESLANVQNDSVIVKTDCRCLRRLEINPNSLVALLCHGQDFSLYGKWTRCLADELEKSSIGQFSQSLQSILTTVNKTVTEIATAAKCCQIADYHFSPENIPSLDATVSQPIAR